MKGKHDLEGAHLQQMLERSCRKINNKKNKFDMVLCNTSQNYEVTTCHSREEELDWYEQGNEKILFTGRIIEELGSL